MEGSSETPTGGPGEELRLPPINKPRNRKTKVKEVLRKDYSDANMVVAIRVRPLS